MNIVGAFFFFFSKIRALSFSYAPVHQLWFAYELWLLIKLPIHEYNYVYCKKYRLLYQLLLSLKYFLWDITYKNKCWWVLAVLYCNGYVFRILFSIRIVLILLTNWCVLEYQLHLLCKVFLTLTVIPWY